MKSEVKLSRLRNATPAGPFLGLHINPWLENKGRENYLVTIPI
jgi:hypothetical protein